MFPELSEDIFRIIFIDQEILLHDIIQRAMVFHTVKKVLLILEKNPGIRDKGRWDKSMGMVTFFTPDALYNEGYEE